MAKNEELKETDPTLYKVLKRFDRQKFRNLAQYRDLSDKDFDEMYAKKILGATTSKEFEQRIQNKIDEFSDNYDLADMNSNDKMVLRALSQALVTLEDLETETYMIRTTGIDVSNIELIEKLSKVMSGLRNDISKMQEDLNITRKHRKSDKETSVIDYLEKLKVKAREFYESRMAYIYCPNCHTLLGTIWTLYPEEDRNKIALVCNAVLDNGEKCGTKVIITTSELLSNRQINFENIPEMMK